MSAITRGVTTGLDSVGALVGTVKEYIDSVSYSYVLNWLMKS